MFTDVSWYGAGLKTLKFSKSVKRESCTCTRTVATCSSAITRRSCSTERTPPALPYPTNPATLLFHSLNRKSIAFLSAAGIPWLYSAVTKTNASKESIFAAKFWCDPLSISLVKVESVHPIAAVHNL